MGSGRCANVMCGATESGGGEWKKGWGLRSGGFATLCLKCGVAYEQLVFCDMFHQKESGWRECFSCQKRLHCGCVASKSSFDLLDGGGVQCIGCIRSFELSFMPNESSHNFLPQPRQKALAMSARSLIDEKVNCVDSTVGVAASEMPAFATERKVDASILTKGKITSTYVLDQTDIENGSFGHLKWEQMALNFGDGGLTSANRYQPLGSSPTSQRDDPKDFLQDKAGCGSLIQASLSMSIGTANQDNKMGVGTSAERPFLTLPLTQQMQRARYFLPKPPKTDEGSPSDISKDIFTNMRVARPPAEGRGRNQLLPRYWPRITDQELQQISGDSNSTIVPLFEKVLSASDAGRIGRLVLPKACAEAYFPPISQPEGLPLTIQDAKGKEWHFQFRFWPNNNSRMYVLEGVTPCIQSLQLQAGDTVTFSRIDPEGKLVMGFRKATNTGPLQDPNVSSVTNGALGNETFYPSVNENLPIVSGYSGLLQSLKGGADVHLTSQSENLNSSDLNFSWLKADKLGGKPSEGLEVQPFNKRSRNIGAKSRRLLMDTEDALELKLTWEEAQDLLRPPPSSTPSIFMIDDNEVEEYEEPPVFGKRTIFTARASGEYDQWVQCDECFKWRRLPVDILISSKWTCAANTWDPPRSTCTAPDELSQKEMHILLQQYEDLGRRRIYASLKQSPSELAGSGLDAFTAMASVGDGDQTTSSVATTTRHPRHRPGCTCIVCIQPPSGKGSKHHPSCTCNVCMTVKRRFKTLMLRKKKRQSEREEAEANKKVTWTNKEETEGTSSSSKGAPSFDPQQENEFGPVSSKTMIEKLDAGKGQIDLNFHPGRDELTSTSNSQPSMMSLLQVANQPLETYLKQNGFKSLACEQGTQESPNSVTIPQAPGESEGKIQDENTSIIQERDNVADEGCDVEERSDAA